MADGKEIISKIGRHRFITTYDADAKEDKRWKWRLTVVVNYEYVGSALTPAMCRVEADQFVKMHERLDNGR